MHQLDAMEVKQRKHHEGKWDFLGLFTNSRHFSKDDALSMESGTSPAPDVYNLRLQLNSSHNDADDKLENFVRPRCWTPIEPIGKRPAARCNHAATVIGRRMIVVGGESDGRLLNDVQLFHLGKLTWSELAEEPPRSPLQQLPPCRGHSLVSWGKTVLLVGGDTTSERVCVWSFDLEVGRWTKIQAKGEIPISRSGQSVTRAGSILVMFGGEDRKGRKLNDIHVLDLKSLMWLPLHTSGKGPSPRAKHVAVMYDERYLLVFGGVSKSKVLNDTYSLDFETMEWSRLKPSGCSPRPRAGGAGVMVGDRWYICGGGDQRGTRVAETIALDVSRMVWTIVNKSSPGSLVGGQGLSLVMVQKKDKAFLVAFGGSRGSFSSNEVEVLYVFPEAKSPVRQPGGIGHGVTRDLLVPCTSLNIADTLVTSDRSVSESEVSQSSSSEQSGIIPGLVPLRKIHQQTSDSRVPRIRHDFEKNETSGQTEELGAELVESCAEKVSNENDLEQAMVNVPSSTVNAHHSGDELDKDVSCESIKDAFEEKVADALRRNSLLEAQLGAVVKEKEEAVRELHLLTRAQQVTEAKLAAVLSELEELRIKLTASELAQEESNSLSNIVHAENVKLEHDLSLLKAAFDDAHKELHSTRGVLASERSRAFQLQVELFELKQKVHS